MEEISFDPKQRKPRRKPTKKKKKEEIVESGEYTYEFLLNRAFKMIGEQDKKSLVKIPSPQVFLIGTKKTQLSNFTPICKAVKREPQHLIDYMSVELGTIVNLDGDGHLIISGRFSQKQIEIIVTKYIDEYVICKTCGCKDTSLIKENRLQFIKCCSSVCGSRRTVSALKKGYVHTLKREK